MESKVVYLPRHRRAETSLQNGGGAAVEVLKTPIIIPITRPRLVRPVLSEGLSARWSADPDDGNTIVSAGWVEMFGQDAFELMMKGWLNYIHPDDRFHAALRRLENRRNGRPYQNPCRTLVHGVYRYVNFLVFPVREDGELIRWEGYCQMIEDDKAANF
jgi:PAS domain-containing protein